MNIETKKYKTEDERFIGENTNMIYVDAPYYDFLIIKDKNKQNSNDIKLEIMQTERNHQGSSSRERGRPRILFRIRKGRWLKHFEADYITAVIKTRIFYGEVTKINEYIKDNIPESVIEKSYLSWSGGGRKAYLRCGTNLLESLGLLKSISISNAHKLEELIREEYEPKDRTLNPTLNYAK